jgi:hypothetical protein
MTISREDAIRIAKESGIDIFAILMEEIQREFNAEILGVIKGERPAPPPLPPLPNPGVLGIIREGEGKYRRRGYGTEDQRFQNHLSGLAVCTGDDWPWSYYTLEEGVTHEEFIAGFERHYMGEDKE